LAASTAAEQRISGGGPGRRARSPLAGGIGAGRAAGGSFGRDARQTYAEEPLRRRDREQAAFGRLKPPADAGAGGTAAAAAAAAAVTEAEAAFAAATAAQLLYGVGLGRAVGLWPSPASQHLYQSSRGSSSRGNNSSSGGSGGVGGMGGSFSQDSLASRGDPGGKNTALEMR
jgi:hypothetical protein